MSVFFKFLNLIEVSVFMVTYWFLLYMHMVVQSVLGCRPSAFFVYCSVAYGCLVDGLLLLAYWPGALSYCSRRFTLLLGDYGF